MTASSAGAPPSALTPALAARLRDEVSRLGTPLFAYDAERIDAEARRVRAAFPDPNWTRLYSLKANGLPGLVSRIAGHGFGANAVSRGEVSLAFRAGVPPNRTALEGIGKTPADLRTAIDLAEAGRPLLWVSLESTDEAAALAALARRRLRTGRAPDVLVRVNPSVDPDTEPGLAVGRGDSKFGVPPRDFGRVVEAGGGWNGPLRFRGVHVHVGSQLGSVGAWESGVAAALKVFASVGNDHTDFDTIDAGGGFPAGLEPLPGADPAAFAAAASRALRDVGSRRPSRLAIEPGRALVAGAGWLVARVLHVRNAPGEDRSRQVVIDAGMTELIRPALYGTPHPIFALSSEGRRLDGDGDATPALVEGPVCESTDRLGEALLPSMRRGDIVAIGVAGAYASSMGSSYNGRPRPAEVLLEAGGRRILLRRRGSLRSLA
ncbi:diaminopimelate decarboxylase [soil metagenome]